MNFVRQSWGKVKAWIANHRKLTAVLLGLSILIVLLLFVAYFYVGGYGKYVLDKNGAKAKHVRVGIVFGAGIGRNGKPYDELKGRLDGAAELLSSGAVDKLILSGDNRFPSYNEPQAMVDYMVDVKHISRSKLQPDYAGRSTYETCERAEKVFGLKQALLISAPSHLPRAIFTCRKSGIEAYGIAYGADANNALRREFLARNKAIFNIYVLGEKTILGSPIKI